MGFENIITATADIAAQRRRPPSVHNNNRMGINMSLSDALLKLSTNAKQLEQSIEATKQKNDAKIEERRVELQSELDVASKHFKESLDSAADQAASDWAEAQKSVSDAFESLRADARSRRAEWSAKRASRAAEVAEADAVDAVNFAIYAIQEAEYAVLDAAAARAEADAKATSTSDVD